MENLARLPMNQRKSVRKGTRSCTECRRRKIRCIFSSGSLICINCTARGFECIDQRDAGDASSWLRPRQIQRSSHSPASHGRKTGAGAEVPARSDGPEFLAVTNPMQNAELNPPFVSALGASTTATVSSQTVMESYSSLDSYQATVRNSLLSILPHRKEILDKLGSNGYWWDSFQKKTRAISRASAIEPLNSFAIRVMDSGNCAELATLAIGYERSLDGDYSRLAVIERLMMSSFELICSLEGLECIILLAKTYTDIGKPKRAWFTWRKGLAAAQFLGLHRLRPDAPAARWKIWWAIYHGDRFASLLLGLPHGGNDVQLNKTSETHSNSRDAEDWVSSCVFDTCVIAGQVVDHNTKPDQLSFATVMKLEEQMNSIASTAPDKWWQVGTRLPQEQVEIDNLLDRILVQVFFLHVRMYLHLPFLISTAPIEQILVSSRQCFDTAQKLVQRYLLLRQPTSIGHSLFECKTTDFVGFTAAVVLFVAREWQDAYGMISDNESSSSLELVTKAETAFHHLHLSRGCKLAAQCYSGLDQLLHSRNEGKINIPYFGVITLRPRPQAVVHGESVVGVEHTPSAIGAVDFDFDLAGFPSSHFPQSQDASHNQGMGGLFPDIDVLDWDIDQDWGFIL